MKTISKISDLKEYGIEYLTGERCGYSYRGLYDLTEEGVKIVCDCLGVNRVGLDEPWNSRGVASVMLGQQVWKDVAVFALLSKCHTVLLFDDYYLGLEGEEQYADLGHMDGENWVSKPTVWADGTKFEVKVPNRILKNEGRLVNVHQMTGR